MELARTTEVAPRERTGFWSEHFTSYHCRMDYRYPSTDDFHGETIRQCTGKYQIVQFWSQKIGYVRTPNLVRQDPDDDYRFVLPITGELVVRQDNRESRLTPGTGSLLALDTPFELLQNSAARAFILTIPAHEVGVPPHRSSPLATGLDMTTGLGRVAGDMMNGLFEERHHLTSAQFNAVCDRMVELLCLLVAGEDRPDTPEDTLAEVEAAARRYVREHATDPELSCATLAREVGWSLRQVQLALRRAGTTPRELIREERLRLARERLRSPAYRHMSITELAYASGFSSASALSTAFRKRFGMSPRDARYVAEEGPPRGGPRAGS